MSDGTFDAIVVGLGGMGSAALFELARRGRRVLGLEQFVPGHDQGSSHGHTRIIRQAYYEHPAYVPLVRRAYERWYDLEQRQGVHLLTTCPCLSIGPPDGELVPGVRRSATEHSLAIEDLSPDDLRRRYPAFRFGPEYAAVVEPTAGFLFVEECVKAYVREAERLGAVVMTGQAVKAWIRTGDEVHVITDRERYVASRLVLTAGPWVKNLLSGHIPALTVMRQVPMWFGTSDDRAFARDVFPIFIAETPDGAFYGLPAIDANGVKIVRHYGAPELAGPASHRPDGDRSRRGASPRLPPRPPTGRRRAAPLRLGVHLHADARPALRHRPAPDHANVAIAAGFSGHGFKFSSVVGEILADLVETGRTALPIELFAIGRFTV